MAKSDRTKKNNSDSQPGCDYSDEVKRLRTEGPGTLYILRGEETYLRDCFLDELKKRCITGGEDGFGYHRFDGPGLDPAAFQTAADVMPFLSERTFIELRGIDINKLDEADRIEKIIKDIPDYCTAVFIFGSDYSPDGRLKIVKTLKSCGRDLVFAPQPQSRLNDWIRRRFSACGKKIGSDAIERLTFVSGNLMDALIPEIEKVAAYSKGETVTVSDVDAVALRIPEAQAFDVINMIAEKKFDSAIRLLYEHLQSQDGNPIGFNAALGYQFRRMYAAKCAIEEGMTPAGMAELFQARSSYTLKILLSTVKLFSIESLREAVAGGAEAEFKMKSTAIPPEDILKDYLLGIIAHEKNG